jgi:iron uptake system EfeUOB component EfeO/EfeM
VHGRPSTAPLAVAHAAARVLSLDARRVTEQPLVDVESHAAGAGIAFDAIRDALWSRDKGLVGSIDERLATVRVELDAHRRGAGFAAAARLPMAERRRLAAALDAFAWRLELAAERLAAGTARRS